MEFDTYLRFILALLLVLGLIAILAWVLRRFGFGGMVRANSRRRLQVLETTPIGPRHRLVLVRRDAVEHLVLLGPQGDVVVERGIPHQDFQTEMARGRSTPPRDVPGLNRQEPPPLHPTAPGRDESAT
ncbi:flagellar biosynthetic protein FliO [Dongia sp.]|uniref:flagellar biosynthetic protein FliO n=1 Tax=Dongia sp. TaxID=1977262 RepID=UPI0035B2CA53